MRTILFTADFTGQLSTVQGLKLPGTNLRIEQGHHYQLELNEQTGQGRLTDLSLPKEELAMVGSEPAPSV